jgi:XTP/dITP diphosphohydrolase
MPKRLVLATSNRGKLAELQPLLADAGYDLVAQSDLGVDDAVEDGRTFVENALIKARHASTVTGLPALADDSGLVVPALGGAPGLLSARFAGTHGDPAANITRLLHEMRDLQGHGRRAHFFCVLVLLRAAGDPQPLLAEGEWHGTILQARRGDAGFGYDPVFLDPAQGATAAELPPALKNRISHRGQAIARLRERLGVS